MLGKIWLFVYGGKGDFALEAVGKGSLADITVRLQTMAKFNTLIKYAG